MQNVKDLLKPDGVFIGTMIDGELLLEKLREQNGVYHHKIGNSTPLFTICPVNFELDNVPKFGAHIDVELVSSILEQYVCFFAKRELTFLVGTKRPTV